MLYRLLIALSFCVVLIESKADYLTMTFDESRGKDLDLSFEGSGEYRIVTTGNDPFLVIKPLDAGYCETKFYVIEFEYIARSGINALSVFYTYSGSAFSGDRRVDFGELPSTVGWQTFSAIMPVGVDVWEAYDLFRFDLGTQSGKTIQLRSVVLRSPSPDEDLGLVLCDTELSQLRNSALLDYLDSPFTNRIEKISVRAESLQIDLSLTGINSDMFLAEVLPWEDSYSLEGKTRDYCYLVPITGSDLNARFMVDRFIERDGRVDDRMLSRWVLVQKVWDGSFVPKSHARWAEDVAEAALTNLPEVKALSKKGLDGLVTGTVSNFDDLLDIGIHSMKINVVLNSLLISTTNGISHRFNERTYYFNEKLVESLDNRVRLCSDNGMTVAFVLLVSYGGPEAVRSLLVHPDAGRGNYAMANTRDPVGLAAYLATIDFLAMRYSLPDLGNGRMSHWILHNEVDAHIIWTDAGQKPMPLYTDLYTRLLRLTWLIARKYDPSAKVFPSFTKHWNSFPLNWPELFRSKDVLGIIERLSAVEGDFEWGLAWHSYPVNLGNPMVWEDSPVRTPLNFNASEITPRNLEVIDAYIRQKRLLYNGKKVRTVLLSENGMSSQTEPFGWATFQNQAAGVAYLWKKAQALPSIENIQLHRWVDNPNEGGLSFGLWTNGGNGDNDFGTKKPAWFVWQSAGTEQESTVFEPYLQTIGIDSWSEILYPLEVEVTPYDVLFKLTTLEGTLDQVFVTFNGERKRPQSDGSVLFYNVASSVEQTLEVRNAGELVYESVLEVSASKLLELDVTTYQNWLKFAFGTDPETGRYRKPIILMTGGSPVVSFFRRESDLEYRVQFSTNMEEWTDLSVNPGMIGSFVAVTDSLAVASSQRFYRILLMRSK